VGSCEEVNKKTEDPKIAEDFSTNPDHISFSLLLLLLLYAVFVAVCCYYSGCFPIHFRSLQFNTIRGP